MALSSLEGQRSCAVMRVAVRVDASVLLGAGHIMRCLALASELKSRGHQVVFVMRLLVGNLAASIRAAGFKVLTLADFGQDSTSSQAGWLELATQPDVQLQDAKDALALLSQQAWDWLVVDHYALGLNWQQAMLGIARKLLVIDDEADRALHCDVLLNQNPGAQIFQYKKLVLPDCLLLMGPHYALLRPEFSDAVCSVSIHSRALSSPRILVSLGGGNVCGILLVVLSALEYCGLRGAGITVVTGVQNLHDREPERRCRALGYTNLKSTDTMATLMAQADWAIGAGGVSLLERCVMGLPSITLVTAPNQRRGVLATQAQGALVALDPLDPDFETQLRRTIECMLSSPDRLAAMLSAARSLCDGLGTARVADVMQKESLTLRIATFRDADALHVWRNAAVTRKFSGDGQIVTLEQHQQWMQHVLANPAQRLWIASTVAGPVGVLRFDSSGAGAETVAEISVYRVPDQSGRGWGRALIAFGVQGAQRVWPALTRIDARISDDNLASLAAFAACGFTKSTTSGLYQKRIERISL